jgi:DNA-binding response OmpR family regulator
MNNVTKILIVDDDRATSGLLKTVFEMEGFKTVACPDAERVIAVIQRDKPDLVFMDYHLASTESLSILQELKADKKLKHIPVIMTSGLDRGEECLQAGAALFVLKPFRPTNLMVGIRAVLKGS